jgi:hypothetical protein
MLALCPVATRLAQVTSDLRSLRLFNLKASQQERASLSMTVDSMAGCERLFQNNSALFVWERQDARLSLELSSLLLR